MPSTRKASQQAIGRLARALPELLGGSADLTHSNLTDWPGCGAVRADTPGRHINWGVREFGMAAALNGVALHGGFIPFGATFPAADRIAELLAAEGLGTAMIDMGEVMALGQNPALI